MDVDNNLPSHTYMDKLQYIYTVRPARLRILNKPIHAILLRRDGTCGHEQPPSVPHVPMLFGEGLRHALTAIILL